MGGVGIGKGVKQIGIVQVWRVGRHLVFQRIVLFQDRVHEIISDHNTESKRGGRSAPGLVKGFGYFSMLRSPRRISEASRSTLPLTG